VTTPEPTGEEGDVVSRVERSFGESGSLIRIGLTDGGEAFLDPGDPVYTENRGLVARAALLASGDRPVLPVSVVRPAS
jgi:hypothetical protein